jgi:hypothetical protein
MPCGYLTRSLHLRCAPKTVEVALRATRELGCTISALKGISDRVSRLMNTGQHVRVNARSVASHDPPDGREKKRRVESTFTPVKQVSWFRRIDVRARSQLAYQRTRLTHKRLQLDPW